MAVTIRSMFASVFLLVSRAGEFDVQIYGGTQKNAVIGSKVNLKCVFYGDDLHDPLVRWFFIDEKIEYCEGQNLTDMVINNRNYKVCTLTINPVLDSSEGLYWCEVFSIDQENPATVYLNVTVPKPTLKLQDISTGDLVYGDSDRLCVPPGTKRTFKCTLQGARLDRWTLAWHLGDSFEDVASSDDHRGSGDTGGLTEASSKFTVVNSGKGTLAESLQCQATNVHGESITVTAQLQSCSETSGVGLGQLIAAVAVVSVVGSVAVMVVIFALWLRRKRRTTRSVPISRGVQPLADTDVTSYENPSPTGENIPLHVAREYEDRISPQSERTYEDRIPRAFDEHEFDDNALIYEETPMLSDDDNPPPWAEEWKIPWGDLTVDDQILGRGNFGGVRSGSVRIAGEMTTSAIKMLTSHASENEREDFLAELRTMTSIGHHPNIVSLLGACQHQDVLYVALEYLPHGDLRSYLRTTRSLSDSDEDYLSSTQLVQFALDVAQGMEHLAKVGVIHRDLAARNILLGEGLIAKVSDFGLSRGEDIYVQTSTRRVPVRWLAIESLTYKKYTTKSDVWSFGILLWEIVTIGGTPYPSIRSDSLSERLKRGYRLPKPKNCDERSYALMRQCWEEDPIKRPTFTDLVSILSDMDESKIKHTYLSFDRLHYENLSAIQPEFDDN